MKIVINGYTPELVIANMQYGMSGYSPFKNIFITRENVFICLDTEVYANIEDLYKFHGDFCDFISVERKVNGRFSFNFGNLFKEKAFTLHSDEYNILLGESSEFIKLGQECFEIKDLKSEEQYVGQRELENDLIELDSLVHLSSLSTEQLKTELDKAVADEDYERATKIRDILNK